MLSLKEQRIYDYLLKLSRLHQFKELILFLVDSPSGVTYQQILQSKVKGADPNSLNLLIQDSIIEEYAGKYNPSSLLTEILRPVNDIDFIITTPLLCEDIVNHLQSYNIRKQSSTGWETGKILSEESIRICKKLRGLFQQARKDLGDLETMVDNEYCNEKNWLVKKDKLEYADRKIAEIERLIWVNTRRYSDKEEERTQCLVYIVEQSGPFYEDNKDIVDNILAQLRQLMMNSIGRLRNKISKNLECIAKMIDTTSDFERVFINMCITNKLNLHTPGMYELLERYLLHPDSNKVNANLKDTILSLDSLSTMSSDKLSDLNKDYDLNNFHIRSSFPAPDDIGAEQDVIVNITEDVDAIVEQMQESGKDIIDTVNERYPDQDEEFRYRAYLHTAYRLLDEDRAEFVNGKEGFRPFVGNMNCLIIKTRKK